jgi:hypothetical protein
MIIKAWADLTSVILSKLLRLSEVRVDGRIVRRTVVTLRVAWFSAILRIFYVQFYDSLHLIRLTGAAFKTAPNPKPGALFRSRKENWLLENPSAFSLRLSRDVAESFWQQDATVAR